MDASLPSQEGGEEGVSSESADVIYVWLAGMHESYVNDGCLFVTSNIATF